MYEGRFFQNTHPQVFDETISDTDIGFAADSGAYFVKTNQAGTNNPLGGGYRINAAAAKYAETLAAEYYGDHDPYGYLTGGSGGAYTTPGTYFPVLRATSQRAGDTSTPFARVQNLGRVRVVVH